MSNKIAILGCGWLGFPLAKLLLEKEYRINGSTTSDKKLDDLSVAGINAFLISLSEDKIDGDIPNFLKEVSTIIINVPPKLRGDKKENYVQKMGLLHNAISKSSVNKVIFVSSTAVYGDVEGEVSEETEPKPSTESGRQLLLSEAIFKNDDKLQTTIIRFGGLIGQERHPIKMLAGKIDLSNGHHPINLIHLEDCLQIIIAILENHWWNEIFNGVFPSHPKKKGLLHFESQRKKFESTCLSTG